MKKLLVRLILPLVYLAFFVPLIGKQVNPEVFNNKFIQYGTGSFVAIACPVCILCSIYIIFEQHRVSGLLLVALFSFPLLLAATLLCIVPTYLGRSSYLIFQPNFTDIEAIGYAERYARSPEKDVSERIKNASVLYRYWNITTAFLDSDNTLRTYTPTPEDQAERKSNTDLQVKEQAMRNMIDNIMQQIPWAFGIYISAFTLIMGAGLTFFAFRCRGSHKPSNNDKPLTA